MSYALSARNSTIAELSKIDYGVKTVKSVMNIWEERNNDTKEEMVEFRCFV